MDREDARLSARDGRAQSWDGAQLSGRDGLAGFATGQPAAGAAGDEGCVARACKRLRPSAGAAALPPIKGLTDASSFGNKTIGYWSSCCLNLNNVMGAAIVALPLVNQQAGWLNMCTRPSTSPLCAVFSTVSRPLPEKEAAPGPSHVDITLAGCPWRPCFRSVTP